MLPWRALQIALGLASLALGSWLPPAALAQQQTLSSLITQLGDADPAVREAAMRALWEYGQPAQDALETATKSPDPEVAGRARLLLSRIQLGVGPDAPAHFVRLVIQARQGATDSERSQARLRLAAVQAGGAPALARIIAESLQGARSSDPADLVIRELWPADPWAQASLADELAQLVDGQLVLQWLERAAAAGVSPYAAPDFALAVQQRGDLEGAIERWRGRVTAEPSPEHRHILACLLFAAGDPAAIEMLPPGSGAALVPVAWALLDGDDELAARRAAANADELSRHTLAMILARVADDQQADFAAAVQVRQWLKEHVPQLQQQLRDQPVEDGSLPPAAVGQMVRAVVAAMLAGDLQASFALADEIDAPGLVRVHYRRLEFDLGAQVVARHTQRAGEQTRAVQVSQRRMREELEIQSRRGQPAPDISAYARKRIAALDAARLGDRAAAALFGELVRIDDSDPAVRWSWGRALAAAGDERLGSEHVMRALFMPLASPWVRTGLAEEMLLAGDEALALQQLLAAARWSSFVPVDALPVLERLAEQQTEAGQHDEAARALAAGLALLMIEDVYAQLGDRALHFAFYLAAELERTRMNRAIAAGDWPGAQAALARSLAYLPQSEAPIDLITDLDAAGHTELADRIFIEVFAPISDAVGRYPQSSLLCNQAAWLAASCSRRLDTALHLAQSAVTFDPASPAAMDTLAEVYLRRGQPERALEMFERVLALAETRDASGSYQSNQFISYLARRLRFVQQPKAQN